MNRRHRFHGDPRRFEVLASFVDERCGNSVRYVADVAGGRGMLRRILNKKYNYECEVVDEYRQIRGIVGSHVGWDMVSRRT